jgi:hypothetical protein
MDSYKPPGLSRQPDVGVAMRNIVEEALRMGASFRCCACCVKRSLVDLNGTLNKWRKREAYFLS